MHAEAAPSQPPVGSCPSDRVYTGTRFYPSAKAIRKKQRKRRDPSPRYLIIAFCLWLLGAWFVSLYSTDMVRPIRWMVFCTAISMLVFWPALRLSQFRMAGDHDDNNSADSLRTPGRIFVDWICLNLVFQTVIWPLHLNAQWHAHQTWWISATVASWSLIVGAIIALGCRSDRQIQRVVAMGICLMLLVGELTLAAITGLHLAGENGRVILHTSPMAILWELTSPMAMWQSMTWQWQVPLAAVAGLLAWAVVLVSTRWMLSPSSEALPSQVQESEPA